MRKVSLVASSIVVLGVVAGCSSAPGSEPLGTSQADLSKDPELNPLAHHFPTQQDFFAHQGARPGGGGSGNLTYHGGPTITTAHVVAIFWGPSWSSSDPISTSLANFIAAYGESGEYHVITQYSGIQSTSLGTGVIYDGSTPPTNVTDADVQAEVTKNVPNPDPSTIYEVFLPSTSYSSDGRSDSCGGPRLSYCAYHSSFNSGTVKYASLPYPSCGGCQSAGFSVIQNFEHFISHETREAVTDENGNAWYDSSGNEADDKCAWSPTPFTDGTVGTNADGTPFAYQYEWSNANSGCIKSN